MAREDLHFRLRIPEELKQRIEAHADLNGRSMTAEIIARLTDSVNDDARLRVAQSEIAELRERMAFKEGVISSLRANIDVFLRHLASPETGNQPVLDSIVSEIRELVSAKAND